MRKYVIYTVVLSLAAGALLVDRLTATRPTASAQPAPAAPIPPAPMPSAATSRPSSLARQINQLPVPLQFSGMRDVFALPAKPVEAGPAKPSELERFRQAHRLTGLIVGPRGGQAVVDGKPVLPGQSFDGFRLLSVSGRQAIFRSPAGQVALPLETTAVSAIE